MQPEQNSEQAIAISDYWRVLSHRRWLVIGALFVCWVCAWTASWMIPATYRSETLIIVEQQKVPEQYVVSNVAIDLQQRLQTMTEQIMSRTRLQKIIGDFHLYGSKDSSSATDQLVDRMRKDIDVELVQSPGRGVDAFQIYYSAPNPQLAQKIASELTSLFIQENLRAQQEQSEITTEFLTTELDQARGSLAEQETKVREFKSLHIGGLPSQLQSNMGILTGLQSQQAGLSAALNRSQQQKLYLESLLEQYRGQQAGVGRNGRSPTAIDEELARLRNELAAAQARYTDQNPDVIRLKNEIARAERAKQSIESGSAGHQNKDNAEAKSAASAPITQIQGELRANAQEIRDTQAQLKTVEQQIREYQSRLNSVPLIEQKLTDLTRDYDQSKSNYDSLLKKQMQSQMATNLEKRQQGQQFRVLDPPSLPRKPFSPNRLKISLGGLGGGLVLGIGLALLLEFLDPRIRAEKQLKTLVAARILVGIPHIEIVGEEEITRRRLILEWAGGALLFLILAASNAYTFLRG